MRIRFSYFRRAGVSRLFAVLALLPVASLRADETPETATLVERAQAAALKNDFTEALLLTEKALEEKEDATTLRLYAQLCERSRNHAGVVKAYSRLIALDPEESFLLHKRGVAKFMHGDFKGSVADFDVFLKKEPSQIPAHWQRGLSQYGASMFKEGRAQFEAHQEVNRHDVENAVWHFLCVTQLEGVEAARKALIPIRGDSRVPMSEIHELFSGKGSEAAVIEAASAEGPNQRNHLCYAHLYLALYKEALGKGQEALKHYKLAAVDHSMPHYMGETARVFYQARQNKTETAE